MKVMKENDVFSLSKSVEAMVIGEQDVVVLPVGTVVSVVLVFGDPSAPVAYEVEAFLEDSGRYALGTVEALDIQ
ncbi:hypothetical protein DPV79_40655 [Burkholderia reimsis]|uniref:DUF4926 domain-containing protein n=1 Tax=Burkholderia reimsis TaxID=2234132 RepID=A0A365QGC7_9BURK|nr:hypothetical protein [Burkholderia reimsis]RBB31704.1 hypothetical protein DPV79_40655 [Burkholderia reimsis]